MAIEEKIVVMTSKTLDDETNAKIIKDFIDEYEIMGYKLNGEVSVLPGAIDYEFRLKGNFIKKKEEE